MYCSIQIFCVCNVSFIYFTNYFWEFNSNIPACSWITQFLLKLDKSFFYVIHVLWSYLVLKVWNYTLQVSWTFSHYRETLWYVFYSKVCFWLITVFHQLIFFNSWTFNLPIFLCFKIFLINNIFKLCLFSFLSQFCKFNPFQFFNDIDLHLTILLPCACYFSFLFFFF